MRDDKLKRKEQRKRRTIEAARGNPAMPFRNRGDIDI